MKIRLARPTNQLDTISEMYRKGLGLEVLGSFQDHEGFDGVMLGVPGASYHFEFTQQREVLAPRAASSELLWVFYIPDSKMWCEITDQMVSAGFVIVSSHNPYWDLHGKTFEDPEGYRVVIARQEWAR
jgi:hypothetical protein